jgi:phytoene synthase
LDASYVFCRRLSRRAHSSFCASFWLLPREKRRAMHALYAFMRHTDDLGDDRAPPERRRLWLERWRALLKRALAGQLDEIHAAPRRPSGDPVDDGGPLLPALADAVRRFDIPAEHLYAVIDGQEMDLAGVRYETFAQLADYCQRVASAVGLACIRIWGIRSNAALEPARDCGIAFQLTNILRDLREDAERGRIYLPREDLRQCGYSAEDLARGVVDDRFRRLMALEIERAGRLYRAAAELGPWLHRDGRPIFGMMCDVYQQLLEAIRAHVDDVLVRRIRLSRWQKWRIAARWLVLPPPESRSS